MVSIGVAGAPASIVKAASSTVHNPEVPSSKDPEAGYPGIEQLLHDASSEMPHVSNGWYAVTTAQSRRTALCLPHAIALRSRFKLSIAHNIAAT